MREEENLGDGTSLILEPGDELAQAPGSFQALITPEIRQAFADVPGYLSRIAALCPFPNMKAWLEAALDADSWELALHQGDPAEWTAAGFAFWPEDVYPAEVAPPRSEVPSGLPETLKTYYSLVDEVRWMSFGASGGLDGAANHTPISAMSFPECYPDYSLDADAETVCVLGWSLSGDMIVYTQDDRGGWLSHESGRFLPLGTVAETIDWVYGELLAGRVPDLDHELL